MQNYLMIFKILFFNSEFTRKLNFPQFNPLNPLKPGLNQLNPPGWVFDEKPSFLHNPAVHTLIYFIP